MVLYLCSVIRDPHNKQRHTTLQPCKLPRNPVKVNDLAYLCKVRNGTHTYK